MHVLQDMIVDRLFGSRISAALLIPYDKGSVTSYLCENAEIESMEYEPEGTLIRGLFSAEDYGRYARFEIQNGGQAAEQRKE